ncbi:hypothetical protein PR048_029049 [Dryococelus australis]|uniref:Uncharacterized protein n=1 Tax=Dryococelus australis TaxID=614101 RepID=A0ABQ9GCB2_9NEOP|nr:hypothetical protein PR048_029049 [Dryococelus australis]
MTRAEKAFEKIIAGNADAITVHSKRIHLMVTEIDKLLTNICIDAKKEEDYNSNEEGLGEVQDRLTTLRVKLADLEVGRGESSEGERCGSSELPTFGGNLQEWIALKDIFEAAGLQGGTVTLLKSIPVSGANYSDALAILNTRYENKHELVDSIGCLHNQLYCV